LRGEPFEDVVFWTRLPQTLLRDGRHAFGKWPCRSFDQSIYVHFDSMALFHQINTISSSTWPERRAHNRTHEDRTARKSTAVLSATVRRIRWVSSTGLQMGIISKLTFPLLQIRTFFILNSWILLSWCWILSKLQMNFSPNADPTTATGRDLYSSKWWDGV